MAFGRLSRVLKANERFVSCIAFAPDSKNVASGGEDGDVKLWNVETGKEIRAFPAFRAIRLWCCIPYQWPDFGRGVVRSHGPSLEYRHGQRGVPFLL